MKRFRIVLMVPQAQEVVVADAQEAHNEATKFATAYTDGDIKAIVQSIQFIEDIQTESFFDEDPE